LTCTLNIWFLKLSRQIETKPNLTLFNLFMKIDFRSIHRKLLPDEIAKLEANGFLLSPFPANTFPPDRGSWADGLNPLANGLLTATGASESKRTD
jgi:hypothetical protein